MKRINNIDIISVILLTIIFSICITIPSLNRHIEIVIPYMFMIFFLPGYSVLTVLSAKNRGLISKILISILISIIILFLLISFAHYISISFKTILMILTITTLFFAALGYIQRFRASKESYEYLVCGSCGSYYKHKKGKSLDDFGACHCGGKLRYVEINLMSKCEPKRKESSTKGKTSKKSKSSTSKYIICENCGGHYRLKKGESLEDFRSCHCGGKLKYAEKYYKLNEKRGFMSIDIILVLLLTFLCVIFVLTPALNNTVFRSIFSLLLFLFAPGYSLIAALFPNKQDMSGTERIALSFGLSIVVTPLIGLLLNYTPFGIRLESIFISLSLFTILMSIIAYSRRLMLHEDERFSIDFKCYFNRTVESFKRESGTDKILSIILVSSIILAVSATAYVMVPKEGEKFTEFYILGQNGKVSDYPHNLTVGQTGNVTVGIVNHEYSPVNYKIMVKLNNQTIDEKNITLSDNQIYSEPFTFVPSNSGQNQEIEFLLYKLPDENNVYRSLHMWINVG